MQEDDDDDDGEGGSEGAWVVEDDADSDEGDTEAPHYVFFARRASLSLLGKYCLPVRLGLEEDHI